MLFACGEPDCYERHRPGVAAGEIILTSAFRYTCLVPALAVAMLAAGCADSRMSANNAVTSPGPQASSTAGAPHGGMYSSTGYTTNVVTMLNETTRDDVYEREAAAAASPQAGPVAPGAKPGTVVASNGQPQAAAAPQPKEPPPVIGLYGTASNAHGDLYHAIFGGDQ